MNKYISLKILDFFRPFFTKVNVDFDMMRSIVEMKLTMDARRIPTVFHNNKNNQRDNTNQFLKSLIIYVIYGITIVPFIFFGENYMFQMSIIFGISMFILMTSLISDFSTVLLDVRDKTILNTKPVDLRTINAAKLVHVTIYITLLAGAFLSLPIILMIGVQGFTFTFLFLVEMIFLILFITSLTALVYIFILRYFNAEKLKDIINYIQILLSVGIIIGYQIVIHVFDFISFNFTYDFNWWHLLIPPMWFGAPFELFLNSNYTPSIIMLAIVAIVIPVGSIMLYYRLMPTFETNLEKLMEETGEGKRKKHRFNNMLERILCLNKEERIFFRFVSIMMSQERDFKLRIYPALGLAFVFPFIMLFNQLNTSSLSEISEGYSYFTIYFSNIIIGTVVYMLKFSQKYKGAWIFQVTPIRCHSQFYSAALKAFFVKLYLPIYGVLSVIYLVIFSTKIVPDLIVMLLSTILLMLISYKILNNGIFPFSEPVETAQQSGSSLKTFFIMIFVAIFAGIHFVVKSVPSGLYIYLVVLLMIVIGSWKVIFPKAK